MKFTYNDIVHEIQRIVNVDLMRKKEISFQQSQMPKVVNAVGKSKTKPAQKVKLTTIGKRKDGRHCTSCGMDGHLAEKCWKDEICTGCGGQGHIEAFCSSKEKSKPSSSSSSSSSTTPAPKVNLPKLFVDKNPAK
jgi:uncharacterized FAD-dependent dehydrogenase